MVVPEDVQAVFAAVAGHRLLPAGQADTSLDRLVAGVAIP
jgi:MoxR-like ATPase